MHKIIPVLISSSLFAPLGYANFDFGDHLSVSGFGSTSWAKSDNEMPLFINREIADSDCFDCDTTAGLQLDLYYEGFHASGQLVKRPQDKWRDPELEWAYLAYSTEHWTFKVGRLRNPLFLYSEYYYVGQAYTPARPPSEVYNSILGITFYEGGSVTYTQDIGDEYTLAITPFIGLEDDKDVKLNNTTFLELKTHDMVGINLTFSSDYYRWNFSYLNSEYDQKVTFTNFPVSPSLTLPTFVDETKGINIELFSLGAEYEFDSFTLTAEAQKNDRTYSWYLLGAQQLGKWTPYISYAQQYNDDDKLDGDSVLIGTRYDLLYNLSVNAEWQYFSAESGQNGSFIDTPSERNANLFTIMLNVVF